MDNGKYQKTIIFEALDEFAPAKPGDTPGELVPGEAEELLPVDKVLQEASID